tara:strand:- start:641 stop:877 length:237 start_codon:yes stop_codon:yes gene_type:complete
MKPMTYTEELLQKIERLEYMNLLLQRNLDSVHHVKERYEMALKDIARHEENPFVKNFTCNKFAQKVLDEYRHFPSREV